MTNLPVELCASRQLINNDDDDDDDNDDYSCNSVNFKARTSSFCMEVDLHNTYNMILMKMMIMTMMIMMIKIFIAVIQSILKSGPSDVPWN